MPRRRPPPRPGALADLNPVKILSQIALLQVWYYIIAAVLMLFTSLTWGQPISTDLIFDWRTVRRDNTFGWVIAFVWILNSGFGAIAIFFIVARSKRVLDFALTTHLLHLIFVSIYSHSFPSDAFWWLIQVISSSAMTLLATWACQRRELQPMSFGGPAILGRASPSPAGPSSRARSRSRSVLDSAAGTHLLRRGEYDLEEGIEMMPLKAS